MKKAIRTILITLVLLTGATVGLLYWLTQQKKGSSQETEKLLEEESGESIAQRAYIFSTPSDATSLLIDGAGKNVLVFDNQRVYDVTNSKNANDRLTRLASRTNPTFDEPLIAYNPYGTNPNTFYFYFETNRKVSVKYTITVADDTIPDFVRRAYNGADKNISQKHSFTIGGLIPGMENYIILTLCSENGDELESKTYSFNAAEPESKAPKKITVNQGKSSTQSSSTGLYFTFPEACNYILSYDNSGNLRGETLLEESAGKRIVFNNDNIFYQISKYKMAKVSTTGQVMGVYSTNKWGKLMDYDYDGFGNLYAVTQKKGQSSMVKADIQANKVSRVMKFDKKVQASSITVPGDGSAYVSSQNPDGVLAISGVASTVAKVNAVFGKAETWSSTRYSKKVFKKKGKYAYPDNINLLLFNSTKTSLSFLNNNQKKGGSSHYYEYQWKDDAKSFSILRDFKVPYSRSWGSGQWYQDHYIVCSGNGGMFAEYDTSGKMIKEFTTGLSLRSVLKMDLKQTCFY